jgi:glycosyltransferase 2 family protein
MPTVPKPVTAIFGRTWVRALALSAAVGISLWSFDRVPDASWWPALLGLLPWAIGKYILCPLRWHALSVSGRSRGWHLRVYAESELLGLVSPGHAGADVWRVHKLEGSGMNRTSSIAEVALDRLMGAIGLTLFVVAAGATLPHRILAATVGIAAFFLLAALLLRRLRPQLLADRPLPRPTVAVKAVVLSMAYQLSIMCMLMGTVAAMGQMVHPLQLLGVFGASQVAGIIPGMHGASPREGALVVGLASLGITWSAALGAVALTALLAWLPALVLGGGSFVLHRLRARFGAPAPAAA